MKASFKFASSFTVLILSLLLSSCQYLVDLTTDDSMETISYAVKPTLKGLTLLEDMDLELIESDDSMLIINGPAALLDELILTENEGILEIDYQKFGNWRFEKPHLQLMIPEMVPIRSYRHNNVFATDTLHSKTLYFLSDGTGDIEVKVHNEKVTCIGINISNFYISGVTSNLNVSVSYGSRFEGTQLRADKVRVNSNSSNNQFVFPVSSLTCFIRQQGNVYYLNEPEELNVSISEDAKGKAIFKNAGQ